jgi:DNA-binding transcriptional ArsR family regulator
MVSLMRTHVQIKTWNDNKKKIINELQKEKLTFTELIKRTGLSKAVVNQHLKELIKDKMVEKILVNGKILNVLQTENLPKSLLFAANSLPYRLNNLDLIEQSSGEKEGTFSHELHFQDDDLKERLKSIAKRSGVFLLFSILKSLEERDLEWVGEALDSMRVNPYVFAALGLYSLRSQIELNKVSQTDLATLNLLSFSIDKKDVIELRKNLERAFPEEIKEFERILKEIP